MSEEAKKRLEERTKKLLGLAVKKPVTKSEGTEDKK